MRERKFDARLFAVHYREYVRPFTWAYSWRVKYMPESWIEENALFLGGPCGRGYYDRRSVDFTDESLSNYRNVFGRVWVMVTADGLERPMESL